MLYILAVIVDWVISAYIAVLFIRMIMDLVSALNPRWYPQGVVASLVRAVYVLTDPPLRWLRRFIPPIRMGGIAIDLSFIVLYFVLVIARILI